MKEYMYISLLIYLKTFNIKTLSHLGDWEPKRKILYCDPEAISKLVKIYNINATLGENNGINYAQEM